nr:hypothetical protein [Tanacetum cinerariifolium]
MPIPNKLISNNIRNTPYYSGYLEMVAKHNKKITAEKEGKKKPTTAKQPKPKHTKEKSSKPAPTLKPKVTKEKFTKPSHAMKIIKGKITKVKNVKSSFQLVDEPDDEPAHFETEPEPDYQGEEATQPLPVVKSKGKAIATEEQAAHSLLALHTPKRRSTTDQFILQRQTLATKEASTRPSAQPQDDTSTNIVHESPSPADAETGANIDKINSGGDTEILQIEEDQRKDVDNQVNLEEKTTELDQGQDGSDAGKTPESRPQPEHLKLPADEQVILEEPLSLSGTLSSMKNLDDAYTFGD